MKRKHITLSGKVQMVGFRFYAVQNAMRLGINGFVRNRRDGGVEVVAEGEDEQMEEFVDVLKKGPPASRVEDVSVEDYPSAGESFSDFEVRY